MPVAVLMLALPNIACALLAVTLAIVSMGMLTYPIWPALEGMLAWHQKLLTHQGTYGHGPEGLPPLQKMLADAHGLLVSEPLLPVVAGALLMAMILVGSAIPPTVSAALGFASVRQEPCWMAGQLALVAKHPHPHYLVPAIAAAALLAPVALHVMAPASVVRYLAPAIIVLSLPLLVDQPRQWMAERLGSTSRAVQATQHLLEVAAQRDCRALPYYRFSSIPVRLSLRQFLCEPALL